MPKKTSNPKTLTGDRSGKALPPASNTQKVAAPVAPSALSAAQIEQDDCVAVTPYRHPQHSKTVSWHRDGTAYTATGIEVGPADEKAAQAAAEALAARKSKRTK
jgi:hypothetical protein